MILLSFIIFIVDFFYVFTHYLKLLIYFFTFLQISLINSSSISELTALF